VECIPREHDHIGRDVHGRRQTFDTRRRGGEVEESPPQRDRWHIKRQLNSQSQKNEAKHQKVAEQQGRASVAG